MSKGGRSRLLVKWVGLGGLLLFLLFLRAGVRWVSWEVEGMMLMVDLRVIV